MASRRGVVPHEVVDFAVPLAHNARDGAGPRLGLRRGGAGRHLGPRVQHGRLQAHAPRRPLGHGLGQAPQRGNLGAKKEGPSEQGAQSLDDAQIGGARRGNTGATESRTEKGSRGLCLDTEEGPPPRFEREPLGALTGGTPGWHLLAWEGRGGPCGAPPGASRTEVAAWGRPSSPPGSSSSGPAPAAASGTPGLGSETVSGGGHTQGWL